MEAEIAEAQIVRPFLCTAPKVTIASSKREGWFAGLSRAHGPSTDALYDSSLSPSKLGGSHDASLLRPTVRTCVLAELS